jgi:hypothetical protein
MLHGIIGFIVFCVAWELMFGEERRKEKRRKKEDEEWRERNWGHRYAVGPRVQSPYSQPRPPVPHNVLNQDLGGYVEHSRRTGATVQIVDKVEITNGNLTAEHHVKISQPYQPFKVEFANGWGIVHPAPSNPSPPNKCRILKRPTAWEEFQSFRQ